MSQFNIFRQCLLRFTPQIALVSISIGAVGGLLAIDKPLYFIAGFGVISVSICFFLYFEQTLIALLILRSGLDIFSSEGLPAAFAVYLDALILAYIIFLYLTKQKIYTDKFFLIFAVWVASQGLWPVLTATGSLELGSDYLNESIREWVRLFSWLMVYLIVSQLKSRLRPEQVINSLFLALGFPLFVATLQLILPAHVLPDFLQTTSGSVFEAGSRINGTLGHPNTFASFLVLFTGLTYWKVREGQKALPWCLLLVAEVFFLVNTKALVGLPMLVVLILVLTIPQLSFRNLIGAAFVLAMLILLFVSTEFGRERLATVLETPLLNSDITINRAILLSWSDGNSFNWRLAQWNFLIEEWKQSPILGYGLGLATYLGPIRAYAHNDYVRVLVEGGIVGSFVFLVFYTSQFAYLVKLYFSNVSPSQKRFCLSLIAIFFGTLSGMITENIWSHTTFFFYWWTLFNIAGWSWSRPQEDETSTSLIR